MIELEVKRPYPVLSSGILYIFEFSSSYSQESVVKSFLSLDSLESFESFNSFFAPFMPYMKNTKFDMSFSLQKIRDQRNLRIFLCLDKGQVMSSTQH